MDAELQIEINNLVRKLNGLAGATKRDRDKVLIKAAEPLRAAIAARTPQSERPHNRYSTPKISRKLRAPKGSGRVVATYSPGNLKKSIQTLRFRRSQAVFIGPKVQRGSRTPDGYYAHMVNAGTVHQSAQYFVEAGVAAAGNTAKNLAVTLLQQKIESWAAQNNMK